MKRTVLAATFASLLAASAPPARADIFGRMLEAAQQRAEDKAIRKSEEAVEESTDKTEEAIRKAASGKKGSRKQAAEAEPEEDDAQDKPARRKAASRKHAAEDEEEEEEAPARKKASSRKRASDDESEAPEAAPEKPAPLDAGKDFTAGTRVLAEIAYDREIVGNFPRNLKLQSGNAEVAAAGKRRVLRATSFGEFSIPLPEVLPLRFTLEFDFQAPTGWEQTIRFDDSPDAFVVMIDPTGGGVSGPNGEEFKSESGVSSGERMVPVQVMADGSYVKVYINGVRVANAPTAMIGRSRRIRVAFKASREQPAIFGPFRVAAGGRTLYQSLMETGRYTAEGILFDSNSDKIRAESAPALKSIGDALAAHADLNLVIEGHTDNVGAEEANKALSERRAASVKSYLVKEFKVAASRLSAQGFGSSVPVASNETAEGRQSNRRVELTTR